MSETTQDTATLEQTLNRTDFGHMLYEHRKTFFAALIAVLVAATGWAIWKQNRQSEALEDSVEVFRFQNGTWASAKADKTTPADLAKAFSDLKPDIQTSPLMIPVALEMGKFLYEKGAASEADAILAKLQDVKNPVSSFFITMQRAVVLEKLGNPGKAVELLEKLSKVKENLMPARVGLELGRLYMLQGEKGKAQSQFETVISTYPNDEQAKLAKLYLARLAQ